MRTAPFTRSDGRTSTRSPAHGGASRTLRTLENRLAAFRHNRPRRCDRRRTHRRLVHRTGPGLRHNQASRGSRWRCVYWSLSGTSRGWAHIARLHQSSRTYRWSCLSGRRANRRRSRGRRSCLQCCWCLSCRSFGRQNCGSCVFGDRRLRFGSCLSRLCRFGGGAGLGNWRRWRLGRNNDGSRRTRYRLRCNKTRRGLRSFDRARGLRAGGCDRRRLRRSNLGTRGRRHSGRRSWAGGGSRLSSLLCDRLQHIARLGDVRQIDFRLELVRRRRSRTRGTGRPTAVVLRKVLLNALSLILLDGA
jgi:hypothetical protein